MDWLDNLFNIKNNAEAIRALEVMSLIFFASLIGCIIDIARLEFKIKNINKELEKISKKQ